MIKRRGNVYVMPDEKESSEKRVNRFKKYFTRSRIGVLLKATRYRKDVPTKREIRQAALIREEHRRDKERKKFYN
jgi:hypothetical protein